VSIDNLDSTTPKQWQSRGQLKTLLGHSIFVVDEGAETLPTIVLLHGFPTASWDWVPIWASALKELSANCSRYAGLWIV